MAASSDIDLISLIVHDLRNPLNAIGMALHMIDGELPPDADELRQDVVTIAESTRSLRRMLKVLGDYNALLTGEAGVFAQPLDPRRLVRDTVGEVTESSDWPHARLHLEVHDTAPKVAEVDANRAKLALSHALGNAIEAADGAEVRVQVAGDPNRWVTRIITEQAPAETVQDTRLGSGRIYRLLGNALERRGLELMIVATVSEELGGESHLTVEPGLRSALVLDWPARSGTGEK